MAQSWVFLADGSIRQDSRFFLLGAYRIADSHHHRVLYSWLQMADYSSPNMPDLHDEHAADNSRALHNRRGRRTGLRLLLEQVRRAVHFLLRLAAHVSVCAGEEGYGEVSGE